MRDGAALLLHSLGGELRDHIYLAYVLWRRIQGLEVGRDLALLQTTSETAGLHRTHSGPLLSGRAWPACSQVSRVRGRVAVATYSSRLFRPSKGFWDTVSSVFQSSTIRTSPQASPLSARGMSSPRPPSGGALALGTRNPAALGSSPGTDPRVLGYRSPEVGG